MKDFTNLHLQVDNLDRYHIRDSIFNAIKKFSVLIEGELLDVGCGNMPYKQYLLDNSKITNYTGLDIEHHLDYGNPPDVTWDGNKIPFEDNSFSALLLTEVLEHSAHPVTLLSEVNRVLKKDAYCLITVPFVWNLHEVPHDEFRYTPFALHRLLEEANFKNIKINAHGAWDASLAQMLGLWVRRRVMRKSYRKILSFILKPLIAYLLHLDKRDNINKTHFHEGFMPTGFSIICQKA